MTWRPVRCWDTLSWPGFPHNPLTADGNERIYTVRSVAPAKRLNNKNADDLVG